MHNCNFKIIKGSIAANIVATNKQPRTHSCFDQHWLKMIMKQQKSSRDWKNYTRGQFPVQRALSNLPKDVANGTKD